MIIGLPSVGPWVPSMGGQAPMTHPDVGDTDPGGARPQQWGHFPPRVGAIDP